MLYNIVQIYKFFQPSFNIGVLFQIYGLIVFKVLLEKFVLVAHWDNCFKNLDASTTWFYFQITYNALKMILSWPIIVLKIYV